MECQDGCPRFRETSRHYPPDEGLPLFLGRVAGLLGPILVVMALPLTFAGKLRVLRTMFYLVHCMLFEASGISFTLLQKLRSAFVSAVWSKKMPLALVGAVLTLLDGPPGCDPGFFIILVQVSTA